MITVKIACKVYLWSLSATRDVFILRVFVFFVCPSGSEKQHTVFLMSSIVFENNPSEFLLRERGEQPGASRSVNVPLKWGSTLAATSLALHCNNIPLPLQDH